MKALLDLTPSPRWTAPLSSAPWPLLPLGARPWLEYALENCVELKISEVWLLLGEGAAEIENWTGDGERWGLTIHCGFLRKESTLTAWLGRNPARWDDGLFAVRGPVFLRKTAARPAELPLRGTSWVAADEAAETLALLSRDAGALQGWIAGGTPPPGVWAMPGCEARALTSLSDYFALNMELVDGAVERYLAPGYFAKDGAYLGYNVQVPPSAELHAPLIVGNDCRFAPLCNIGPRVSIGDHVMVDTGSQLRNCMVLSGTYIGRRLEVEGRIVDGARLIDPADGTVVDVADPWLLAEVRPNRNRSAWLRRALDFMLAAGLLALQSAPWLLLCALLRVSGQGGFRRRRFFARSTGTETAWVFEARAPAGFLPRLFCGLSLDRFQALAAVLRGRLRLCGQERLRVPEDGALRDELPLYRPGAFSQADTRPGDVTIPVAARRAEALYTLYHNSLEEHARLLFRALAFRFVNAWTLDDRS